jgi:excisionase family DNA binding protein
MRVPPAGGLEDQYNVSYPTVRRALAALEGKGLLHRVGTGLYVTRPAPEHVPADDAAPAGEPAPETPAAPQDAAPEPPAPAPADAPELERAQRYLSAAPLNVEEVAAKLGVSKMKVYRLIQDGEIEAWRFGRHFKIPEYAMVEYLARCRYQPGDALDADDLDDGEP